MMRFNVIDATGTVSFVGPESALPALVAACASNPVDLAAWLDQVRAFGAGSLADRIENGLAVFDEHNGPGNYASIHAAIAHFPPREWPVFRVVDEITRQASLQPVQAGVVIFNLRAKRIIQLLNSFAEIQRAGHVRFLDSDGLTRRVRRYRLPADWSLVP